MLVLLALAPNSNAAGELAVLSPQRSSSPSLDLTVSRENILQPHPSELDFAAEEDNMTLDSADFSALSDEEGLGSVSSSNPSSPGGYLRQTSLSEVAARLADSLSGVLDFVSETLSVTATEEDAQTSPQAAVPRPDQAASAADRLIHHQNRFSSAHLDSVTGFSVSAESVDISAVATVPSDTRLAAQQLRGPSHTVATLLQPSSTHHYRASDADTVASQSVVHSSSAIAVPLLCNVSSDASTYDSLADLASQTATRLGQRAAAAQPLPAAALAAPSGVATTDTLSTELSRSFMLSERALAAAFPMPHRAPFPVPQMEATVLTPAMSSLIGQSHGASSQPSVQLGTAVWQAATASGILT